MRKYIIFLTVVLCLMSYTSAAYSEDYQDRYREAVATYRHVTPNKYNHILYDRWMDSSSQRVWVDAAKDYCLSQSKFFFDANNPHRPMDCSDFRDGETVGVWTKDGLWRK